MSQLLFSLQGYAALCTIFNNGVSGFIPCTLRSF
jgi:hypothetical protein